MFNQQIKYHPRIQYPVSAASLFACLSRGIDRQPSFRALYGRAPIAGMDYDPAGPISQDDLDFLQGTGAYSDEVRK